MTLGSQDDLRTLVERCLSGDQAAMLALVERFQGLVFGLCYRLLGQRQDAEDAAQETFVRALKNLHRWDCSRAMEPWRRAQLALLPNQLITEVNGRSASSEPITAGQSRRSSPVSR